MVNCHLLTKKVHLSVGRTYQAALRKIDCDYGAGYSKWSYRCRMLSHVTTLVAQASKARAHADSFTRRRIDHPSFKNCTQGEALEFIHTVGDAVFRPSPRGPDRLLLSLAVSKNVVVLQKTLISVFQQMIYER